MRGRRGRTGEGYGNEKMILVKIAFMWKNKKQIIRQESLIERMQFPKPLKKALCFFI
jgi:hypothetical protein